MNKALISIAMLTLLLLLAAMPVSAYTPPGQGSDNATDVILWHGDAANITANVSLTSNITVTDLQTSLRAAADAHTDALGGLLNNTLNFVLLLAFVAFAYWHRDRYLYVIAGLALVAYAFDFFSATLYKSIFVFLFGVYTFLKAWLERKEARE